MLTPRIVPVNVADLKEGDIFYFSGICIKFTVTKNFGIIERDNIRYYAFLIKSTFQENVEYFGLTDKVLKVIPNI